MELRVQEVRDMTVEEQAAAVRRVSLASADKLKQWLSASGRRWLVFNVIDLVDALPWPAGHEALQQLVAAYGGHRATMETGGVDATLTPPQPIYKGEQLEVEELDRAIRYLVGQITERDPSWRLTNPAL